MVKLNTKNINNHHKAGQSLIELIVAITIGGILLGVATVAVVLILRVNSDTRATQVAVSLAQEYLDNISALSESAWDNIYGLNKGSSYLYSIKNLYLSQISGGAWHTCGLKTDKTAYCWGSNGFGQLGDNSIIDKLTPVQVLGVGGVGNLANVSQISGGAFHTCAIITSGLAYCWGGNGNGQLGDGTTNGALTPVRILDVGGSSYINLNPTAFVKKIMTGSEGLSADGRSFTRYFFIENVNRTSCGVGDITSGSPLNCPINFPGGSNDIAEDPSTQKITINVEWQNNSSLSKTKYITRHRNLILNQSDWSGGPGQIYFSTTTFGAIVNNKFNSSNSMSYSNPGSLETSAPIGSSGELESSIFDSNSISAVNSIMWQGTLNNGNVKFQIASSNNSNGPWDYKGPDGTISTFYSAGSDIPNKINLAYHNNQRYFKYKVSILNNGSTPVVNDIIINWSP